MLDENPFFTSLMLQLIVQLFINKVLGNEKSGKKLLENGM